MSLLRLKDVGKIYVSEGNVAVGIRGVNLSFDRGEFVAITGASGSGKSTLLNVLSGMDTYEEGEFYVEEQPTSHYLQPDWEKYRQEYISFIFQNYNIIESFTVLQNVELALMTISDPIERRKRAIELIERVGLKSHMRHKGSQLSGGQKQRTVIARALAKDSPIILADEPTGNLDSETSKEIIALLREVSKDKLLIMVTHSYDQVKDYATRHVRIYDGAVEADQVITPPEDREYPEIEHDQTIKPISNGFLLGRSLFTAKPRLSFFLCTLMIIGSLGIFFMTGACGDFQEMFRKYTMFRPMEGRLVLIRQDGMPMTDEELQGLAEKYDAKDALHYDMALDVQFYDLDTGDGWDEMHNANYYCTYGEDFGKPSYGRYPENDREVLLRLPIYYQEWYGLDSLKIDTLDMEAISFDIVGIKYVADNSKDILALFTREGYDLVSLFSNNRFLNITGVTADGEQLESMELVIDRDMDANGIWFNKKEYRSMIDAADDVEIGFVLDYRRRYREQGVEPGYVADKSHVLTEKPGHLPDENPNETETPVCYIGVGFAKEISSELMKEESYTQASLFFKNDRTASKVAKKLNKEGYIAVRSDTTYSYTDIEVIFNGILLAFVWGISIMFITYFINLCTNRTVSAFREDIAIMRSMGIPANVIKTGIYVRMFLALIPAVIVLPIVAYLFYHSVRWNQTLVYMQPWQYGVLFVGMIILTLNLTRRQIKSLFGESVKKSLRKGEDK